MESRHLLAWVDAEIVPAVEAGMIARHNHVLGGARLSQTRSRTALLLPEVARLTEESPKFCPRQPSFPRNRRLDSRRVFRTLWDALTSE